MPTELEDVDVPYLVAFCKSNLAARLLLESFACRQKNCRKSSIDALQRILRNKGYNFSEVEVRGCCKAFQAAGCGVIRRAYKERKSQFEWKYSSISISKTVLINQLNVI